MKVLMIVLSFILAYPVFMVFVYYVARAIFTPLEKVEAEKEREKQMLLLRARRIRRTSGKLVHA